MRPFESTNVDHETIMGLSFQSEEVTHGPAEEKKRCTVPSHAFVLVAMVVIYTVCAFQSPMLLNGYSLQLTVVGFVVLMLCTLGQTSTVELGHIDLGTGDFYGLINVLCCMPLLSSPTLSALTLLGMLALHPLTGYVIYKRDVSTIIVTLGMLFLWAGTALSL